LSRLLLPLLLVLATPTLAQDAPADNPTSVDPAESDQPQPPSSYAGSSIQASLTLRVSDKKAAAEQAITLAEAQGGWFSRFEPTRVDVRVPTSQTDAVLDDLAELGDVVGRSYQRTDHSQELAQLEARIEGREKVLARYRAVLSEARASSVVTVERQITQAVAELERLKGRRRYLQNRLEHSTITVSFQFRDRSAPRRDGSSSFAWLNSMNMADLIRDVRRGERASRSRTSVSTPEGFSPYRRRGRFQAITPDDVVFRVRSARNKPRATLEFWSEALKERQEAAGYTVLSEQTVSDGQTYVLELGAANGPQDQTYVIGLRVEGRRLILAEATGEAERFQAHRDAVMQALRELGS